MPPRQERVRQGRRLNRRRNRTERVKLRRELQRSLTVKGQLKKMAKDKKKGKKKKDGRGSGLKNMRISFKKVRKQTLGDVFGTKPISPPDIMRTIWALIKKKKLVKKKKSD